MFNLTFEEYQKSLNWMNSYQLNEGLFNDVDCVILFNFLKKLDPSIILELGPRSGRTTSVIVNAIRNNGKKVELWDYEIDENFIVNIFSYLRKNNDWIDIHMNKNILNSSLPKSIDFALIDGNHDHILARWYVKNIFPLCKDGSLIMIHDMHYDKNNMKWDALTTKDNLEHPDISSESRLRELYEKNIYDNYFESINIWEGDIIKRFYDLNKDYLDFFSTREFSIKHNIFVDWPNVPVGPCSLFFLIKDRSKLTFEV